MLLAVRIFLCICGVALLCLGLFVYEDEEKRLQNRLQELWVTLDDKARVVLAQEATFLNRLALGMGDLIDRVFGSRIISVRSYIVSLGISTLMASLLRPELWRYEPFLVLIGVLGGIVSIAIFVKFPQVFDYVNLLPWFLLMVVAREAILFYFKPVSGELSSITARVSAGVCSSLTDFAVLASSRFLLRKSGHLGFFSLLFLLASVSLAALVIWFVPLELSFSAKEYYLAFGLRLLSKLNTGDAVVMTTTALLVCITLVHHVVWPVLLRPLYALQRVGLTSHRNTVCALGIAFLSSGFGYGKLNLEPIWKAVEKWFG